jgi:hypothetical protein
MFRGERGSAGALPLWLIACATILLGGIGIASAQEIEPGEFVALPPGTNIDLGYYVYKHDTSYYTTSGKKVPDSGIEVNLGVERYVHYTELFGHPAGVQLIEIFGSESGAHVGPESLGSAGGAANLDIST